MRAPTVTPLDIPDVLLIEPKRFGDHRGFFSETYSKPDLLAAGIDIEFVQDNHAFSPAKGTVRGLHFQAPPMAQAKLVRVTRGAVWDVAVDIRKGSKTYGRSVGVELSAENWRQLLVPPGFAHGYMCLTDDVEFLYKVSVPYAPETEGGLLWRDAALGLAWPLPVAEGRANARDEALPTLKDLASPF